MVYPPNPAQFWSLTVKCDLPKLREICMSNNKRSCEITSITDYHSLLIFLDRLAKVLLRNCITTHYKHFGALLQHTDGCTNVPWLLVQAHHSIRYSHKRYTNRHSNQHMILCYCNGLRRACANMQTCQSLRCQQTRC